ncbi:ABC transporter permease [Catellatospora methionotrophica]|uniref:ABC transporter permease n=1 Tax=Catellatospora methionotrophica TaxID=121620 RepID=A0A8J3LDC9_9ACTN|nr:ABC transporter permease [Catellatospora methionotrophica]GIG13479.1 ABC transporter permease [Catellatospora methionotrophica]
MAALLPTASTGTPVATDIPVEPPAGMRRRRWVPYALLAPGLAWLAVFFVYPVFQLAMASLWDPSGSVETGYSFAWAFSNYSTAWELFNEQFVRSLWYALLTTVICVLLGYPLAYAIAVKGGRWKNLMLVGVIAPFFTSYLVRTYSWKAILSDSGPVVEFLRWTHLLGPDGRLLATEFAVIAGLVYNFLPFMVLPLYASLERLDLRLLEAARDLYHGPVRSFLRVTLPLSLPGVLAGTLLTFIPAAGDYVNAQLLGGPKTQMIGSVIYSRFLVVNDYPIASALSMMLMLTILVLVMIYLKLFGTEEVV